MSETVERLALEQRILDLGGRYWRLMQGEKPGLFDHRYWQGRILDWVMSDETFKIDAFRFVDVLPVLHTTRAMATHVSDYLLKEGRDFPPGVHSALRLAAGGIAAPLASRALRANVTEMAHRFICPGDGSKAVEVLKELADRNLDFTADILGEATTSEQEADLYLGKYFDLIDLLAAAVEKWPARPQLEDSDNGPLPRANISVKISALDPWLDPADHRGSVARIKERLLPLLRQAKAQRVFINLDLEQWSCHNITYDLFEEVALDPELHDWPHLGLVVQAYLKSAESDCRRLLKLSRQRGTPFTVRLVKGAYWDYEVVQARRNNFECPVFLSKGATDASYERLSRLLLENRQLLRPAFAGHNLRSLVHALTLARELGVPKSGIEVQMLRGMAEPLRRVLVDDGYRVRIYTPIGELLPGMAYLVRRLLENTSNSGFLRQSYHEGVALEQLLAPPSPGPETAPPPGMIPGLLDSPFANLGPLDFTRLEIRESFGQAVAAVAGQLPREVPVLVGGLVVGTAEVRAHFSPNDPELVVARVAQATRVEAQAALSLAHEHFPAWRDQALAHRAGLLEKLADLLTADRYELAGLQCHEAGKPWPEADADVAEAIDFCRYYARRAVKELGPSRQGEMAGEENFLHYEGRGPCVVIAPWNFPLAILCGMTTAALVAGNPVLIKPATAASATAYEFYRRLLAAGFPPEIVHFLPGPGAEVGSFLVEHPDISQIAFTGSREVGLAIIDKAGKTLAGQAQVKRVVCEMGGKNAIIVDEDADPDAALKGVLNSAFGYAGQKCSACSRLILVGGIYEPFMSRLSAACRTLPLAEATDPGCRLGPVIDRAAHERLQGLLASPPAGARLLYLGETPAKGFFIPPALFEVDDPTHPFFREELFGPILTVLRVEDFAAALALANATDFALTGAVYSRSPRNLAAARAGFKVGNLYLNRGCTGALVGRQPFGGFGMSGIGTKAGGPGYLRNFANPRCITENTMRSGFTPEFQL